MEDNQLIPDEPVQRGTSGTAICSLVFSILGILFCLPIIGSVVGIVCGFLAKSSIAKSRGALGGGTLATCGIVLGFIGIAIGIIGMIGMFTLMAPIVKGAATVAMQVDAASKALERGDVGKASAELTKSGGMSQEEVRAILQGVIDEYGEIQRARMGRLEADKNTRTGNPMKVPMQGTLTVECEKGSVRLEFTFKMKDGRYQLESLTRWEAQ